MDSFSKTILLQNLEKNVTSPTLTDEYLAKVIPTLSDFDIDDIRSTILKPVRTIEASKQVIEMLKLLHKYT